jgi:hypothetical protein
LAADFPPSNATGEAPGFLFAGSEGAAHFRAYGRRPLHLAVILRAERGGWERVARAVDISIAGVGVETDEALMPGERLSVAFATPTLWDPLILTAVVAWAHPVRLTNDVDALGRQRMSARAGLVFDYTNPEGALAMFEMLVAIGFE